MSALPPRTTILQVTPALDAGGVEQTTLDMAQAIVAAGGRALVASAGGRLEDELAGRGGALVRLPVNRKDPLTLWRNAARLERVIRREGVSLVHVRSRAPAFSALRAARRTGVPLVTTYHGVYGARGPLKRWYNAVMTRGDLVIANSEFTREHILKAHGTDPAKVLAIPRGVDLSRFDPAAVSPERVIAVRTAWGLDPAERRPIVLLAGRLTRWKGQALLVEAARLMSSGGGPAFLLVLAGDDQGRTAYRQELEALIAATRLGGTVRIVGHCADMPAAYLAADIACAPSLEPEAFGRTAVEPQVMGRPVLAADHGAARKTVVEGETGWRVTPGDAHAWAKALTAALTLTPEQRAMIGARGRARATALYSLTAMTDATLAVYARLLAGGTGA